MKSVVFGEMSRSVVVRVAVLVFMCSLGAAPSQAAFNVMEDGFSISNEPGYCFAIAAFSRWYYLRQQDGEPRLRTCLSRNAQERIARDLQRFYSRNLIGIQADYCNRNHSDPAESFRRFIVGLTVGEPRLVLLMNKTRNRAVLHAVLAYEWIAEHNLLKVYDPNYPNKERLIDLNRRQYRSLDITYHEICFPEVLQSNRALISKMEHLLRAYSRRTARGPRQ